MILYYWNDNKKPTTTTIKREEFRFVHGSYFVLTKLYYKDYNLLDVWLIYNANEIFYFLREKK